MYVAEFMNGGISGLYLAMTSASYSNLQIEGVNLSTDGAFQSIGLPPVLSFL